MRGRYRWMVGPLVALAMSSAWAEGGRIGFAGAVVESTCAIGAAQLDPANPAPPQVVRVSRHWDCGRTAADSGRTYSRTVQPIDAASIANDRLLGYLASYAPTGPDGQLATRLIVRTYD